MQSRKAGRTKSRTKTVTKRNRCSNQCAPAQVSSYPAAVVDAEKRGDLVRITKKLSQQQGKNVKLLWQQIYSLGLQPDSFAFTAYAKALARNGYQRDALALLDEAQSLRQLSPALFAVLLRAAGEAGSLDDVLRLEHLVYSEKIQRQEAVHGALIDALVRHGKIGKAEKALQAGRTARPPHEKCGVRAYTPLLQWYASHGKIQHAYGVLRTLRADGLQPTKVTMSALVDGFASAGYLQEAEKALSDMKQEGIRPNAITYNALIKGFLRACNPPKFECALSLWEDMRNEGIPPSTDTYNVVLYAYLRMRRTNSALELLRQMKAQATAPLNRVTYTTIMQCFAERNDWQAAYKTFRQLKRLEQPDLIAYNALLHVFARTGRWRRCHVVLHTMKAEPDVVTFQELAWAHWNAGRPCAALEVANLANAHGVVPDERLYGMLLLTAVRAKLYDRALALLAEMEARDDAAIGKPLASSDWRMKHWRILQKLAEARKRGNSWQQQTASGALKRLWRWMGVPSADDEYAQRDNWREVIRAKHDLPSAVEQQYAGMLEQPNSNGTSIHAPTSPAPLHSGSNDVDTNLLQLIN